MKILDWLIHFTSLTYKISIDFLYFSKNLTSALGIAYKAKRGHCISMIFHLTLNFPKVCCIELDFSGNSEFLLIFYGKFKIFITAVRIPRRNVNYLEPKSGAFELNSKFRRSRQVNVAKRNIICTSTEILQVVWNWIIKFKWLII